MGWCLTRERVDQRADVMTRFDPAYWTVNFPRPMMASVVTTGHEAMRVDCVFYGQGDLAGLIWDAEDRHDHPLLRYETARDFRECTLSFRWRSGGVLPLDAIHGPTLTIEGRDAAGVPRAWFVRLWNYASGTPTDAAVRIDFAALAGGFLHPEEADPVWAGDVDRMFISLVPPGYVPKSEALLDAPVEGWAELSALSCNGAGAVLAVGDIIVPEHALSIAGGYDDSYHMTPERLLHNVLRLGYRGATLHYVGMSHFFRLERSGEALLATAAGGALNVAAAAWHRDFARRARALDHEVIWSLSYELLDRHCPEGWKQRAADGSPGLTGWDPPSALLSPCNEVAMAYLHEAARAFLAIGEEAGLAARFQIGEPWWWVTPDGRPCLYDEAAVAAIAPAAIATMRQAMDADQIATLDRAGAALAASTTALSTVVRGAAPDAEVLLLTYLPTVLDAAMPEAKRMNMPTGWAAPAFDVLQLEDYDWVTAGNTGASAAGAAAATARLAYPMQAQDYLSGFVLRAEDRADWERIMTAAAVGRERGVRRCFVWALPQVLRDGLVHWNGEGEVQAFDDVVFPLALGREAEVSPEHATTITASAAGRETRNAAWAEARTRYDVGPGVRSEADIAALLDFFRARRGPARGFRLRDPFDATTEDALIGTGDGERQSFALVKRYGDAVRRITRPVAGTVRVEVAGVATEAFSVGAGGIVSLDRAPAVGAPVTASFVFDVPVRFAEERLTVSRATFAAGAATSVPLIEVREA